MEPRAGYPPGFRLAVVLVPSPGKTKLAPTIRNQEDQFEREVRRIALNFNSQPIVQGTLLTGIALTTATSNVSHTLGRPYKGWIVVDRSAAQHVYRDTTVTDRPELFLPLRAGGTVTVSLWVF